MTNNLSLSSNQLSVKQLLLRSFLVQKINKLELNETSKRELMDKKPQFLFEKPSKNYPIERITGVWSQSPIKPNKQYRASQSVIFSPKMIAQNVNTQNNNMKTQFHMDNKKAERIKLLFKQHKFELPQLTNKIYKSRSQNQSFKVSKQSPSISQHSEVNVNEPKIEKQQIKFNFEFKSLIQKTNIEQARKIKLILESHQNEIDQLKLDHEQILIQQSRHFEIIKQQELKAVKTNIVRLFMERDVYPQRQPDIRRFKARMSIQLIEHPDDNLNQDRNHTRNHQESPIQKDSRQIELRNQIYDLMNFTNKLIMMFNHHLSDQIPHLQDQDEMKRSTSIIRDDLADQEEQIPNEESNLNNQQRDYSFQMQISSQINNINQKVKQALQRYEEY